MLPWPWIRVVASMSIICGSTEEHGEGWSGEGVLVAVGLMGVIVGLSRVYGGGLSCFKMLGLRSWCRVIIY